MSEAGGDQASRRRAPDLPNMEGLTRAAHGMLVKSVIRARWDMHVSFDWFIVIIISVFDEKLVCVDVRVSVQEKWWKDVMERWWRHGLSWWNEAICLLGRCSPTVDHICALRSTPPLTVCSPIICVLPQTLLSIHCAPKSSQKYDSPKLHSPKLSATQAAWPKTVLP